MALTALLAGVYHLSRRRTAAILGDVLGIDISVGAISAVEGRASEACKPPADEAWDVVDRAEVKHADATTCLHKGVTRQLWVLASSLATVFKIVVDGSAETNKPLFGVCIGNARSTAANTAARHAAACSSSIRLIRWLSYSFLVFLVTTAVATLLGVVATIRKGRSMHAHADSRPNDKGGASP